MPRHLQSPSAGSTVVGKILVEQGGTGSVTTAAAHAKLNTIDKNDIDKPNGVGSLDATAHIPLSLFKGGSGKVAPAVDLSQGVVAGTERAYPITNFDFWEAYEVTKPVEFTSTVRLENDKIFIKGGTENATEYFLINGRRINFTVGPVPTLATAPYITSPFDQAINQSTTNLYCQWLHDDAYYGNVGQVLKWELRWSLSPDFTALLGSTILEGDIASPNFTIAGPLPSGVPIYVQARLTTTTGRSNWSTNTYFFTCKSISVPLGHLQTLAPNSLGTGRYLEMPYFNFDSSKLCIGNRLLVATDDGTTINSGGVDTWTADLQGDGLYYFQKALRRTKAEDSPDASAFGYFYSANGDCKKMVVGKGSGKKLYVYEEYDAATVPVFDQTVADTYANKMVCTILDLQTIFTGLTSIKMSRDGKTIIASNGWETVDGKSGAGKVVVFKATGVDQLTGAATWDTGTILSAPNPATRNYEEYGWQVDVNKDGSAIVVYQANASQTSVAEGAAYIYKFVEANGWMLSLAVPNLSYSDSFPITNFSADGQWLAIGSPYGYNGDSEEGFVAICKMGGTNWNLEAVIKGPVTAKHSDFGAGLALNSDGSILAVGAPNSGVNSSGKVYFYGNSGNVWDLAAELDPPVNNDYVTNGGQFGFAMAFAGDDLTLAVTTTYQTPNSTGNMGRVEIFYTEPVNNTPPVPA